jgi:hypothetical protein
MRTNKHIAPQGLLEFFEAGNSFGCWADPDLPQGLEDFEMLCREVEHVLIRKNVRYPKGPPTVSGLTGGSALPPGRGDIVDFGSVVRRKALGKLLANKSEPFRRYILGGAGTNEGLPDESLFTAAVRYKEFCRRAEIVAAVLRSKRSGLPLSDFRHYTEAIQIVTIDDRHRLNLQVVYDRLLSGLEIGRIDSCRFCRNVFYLERINTFYCSSRCSAAFRQNAWRSRTAGNSK